MTLKSAALFVVAVGSLIIVLSAGPAEGKPITVRGSVSDEANAPIPKALVELVCVRNGKASTLASTKSERDGHFQFEAALCGRCKVKITAAGFASSTTPISGSSERVATDVGMIRLRVSCSGPGVICDEVTPKK